MYFIIFGKSFSALWGLQQQCAGAGLVPLSPPDVRAAPNIGAISPVPIHDGGAEVIRPAVSYALRHESHGCA
jgi:hypothetical protein